MISDRVLAIALVCVASISSGAPVAVMADGTDDTYYSIKVSGGPDDESLTRLKMFYARLLTELKVNDLGFANVGCDRCEKLDGGGPPVGSLKFAMVPDAMVLAAFAMSYHYVQSNWHHELFTMSIDGVTPSGTCPVPLPTGCAPRTICIQTSSCDKPYGGSCVKCQ